MDAVTYPDAAVQNDLRMSFAGLTIDLVAKHSDLKEASGTQRVFFAPAFIVTDAAGREIRRWIGWLAPEAFRAELRYVRGHAAMQRGDLADAVRLFAEVGTEFGSSPVAPEALYWRGIAGFLAGKKDFAQLRAAWEPLAREYPDSRFGMHASVIADAK